MTQQLENSIIVDRLPLATFGIFAIGEPKGGGRLS